MFRNKNEPTAIYPSLGYSAECAQLREQLQEVGAMRDDLLKLTKKTEAQLELYKSICTCLDNFE